ncbi:MAG: hypothetical protein COX81_00720 [Candidatus Magasanikbacteria bacterium CG_4_10_14_0_2_um_filter_37_12]|uniref:Uncharacterized protein n=1 Tax=Candidatus Magasanikbacteria bacterium CG_4_10_14_0_2_um_filter_37_12 TaxID=1974637 RepID=A0A2M7V9R7_9BACT|nr:MAG: hypothetical protein COX81_00720 [Candidatus Magasanikbacteria bacterium CG_4_10_14_0_2_um_filter_37_12]
MFLESCLPIFPSCTEEWYLILSGILGAILLIYSQFVEPEHRRDIIRFLGAGGLFVYSDYVSNTVFMIASAGIGLAALIEFIEILIGVHKHLPEDLKTSIKRHKGMKK